MRLASDARLVGLIREGRRFAFEVAYDRHHLGILAFCRHMLADAQEAEDAVQHTFLAAYNDLISSDKPIELKAWLFAIARNRCYSVLRARREQPAADLTEVASEGLAAQVQRRQDLRDLVLDMRRLPAEQRAALVLAELDSLSHEEIGAALGVPREKVKALVFQARESLVASRDARETDCTVIRAQLSTERGGALRRANLRRHLRECPGCRAFRRQVERQRRQLAVLLPVAPAFALKESVLTAAVTGGAGAGAGLSSGAGLLAGMAVKSGLMKGAISVVVAAVGAGTIAAAGDLGLSWTSSGLPLKHRLPPGYVGSQRALAPPPAVEPSGWAAAHRTQARLLSSPSSRPVVVPLPPGPSFAGPQTGGVVPVGGRAVATPTGAGNPRPQLSISRLTPDPAQRGSGEQPPVPLAPSIAPPISTPDSSPAPTVPPVVAPVPASGSTGFPTASIPGPHADVVRVGHDDGGGGGAVTGSPSGPASSGPSGEPRAQDGSGMAIASAGAGAGTEVAGPGAGTAPGGPASSEAPAAQAGPGGPA